MGSESKTNNKVGRPAKPLDEALTKILNFRVRPPLHAKVLDAAKLEGRPVSEVVETRLSQSFQREAAVAEMFGSEDQRSLLLAIGHVVRLVDDATEFAEATQDEGARLACNRLQAAAAVIELLQQIYGMPASKILDAAFEIGGGDWRDAASRVASLDKPDKSRRQSISEIMGR